MLPGTAGIAILAATGGAAAQCAMCNTAAGSGSVGRGLSISVLFMLGVLASVVASLVVLVVRSGARGVTRRDQEGSGFDAAASSALAEPDSAAGRHPAPGLAPGVRPR